MHGHLAAIKKIRQYKPWNMDYYMRKSLSDLKNNLYIIVLGESIRKNVVSEIPSLRNQLYSIEHPFLRKKSYVNTDYTYKACGCIKIGTIGVGSESRGLLLLNIVNKYIYDKKLPIELYHIGKTTKGLREKLNRNIKLPFITEKMIPEEEYLLEVSKLDYILYLHDKDSYKLTASGALFEAFSLGKPIISLTNDYFSYIMKIIDMKVGYILDTVKDLCEVLEQIVEIIPTEYDEMRKNSVKALDYFSPKVIGGQIAQIIR